MKKGTDTVTLKAGPPAYGGLSIARLRGKVVMLKGAIPGETVEARVDEEKKDYSTATVIKVIEPSPDRVGPPCRYFGTCGGCQLQYISYERQVRLKEEILGNCLRRIAGLEPGLSGPLVNGCWGYRHRGQFKLYRGRAGFFRERSWEVVDIESCPLMIEEVNDGLKRARRLLKGFDAREIHISSGGGLLALVKAAHAPKAGWEALAKAFLEEGFTGVLMETRDGGLFKSGAEHITLDLVGLKYTVSPMSFFQGHWRLNQDVVLSVLEGLRPLAGARVLDLYSGAGNFSLPIAAHASEVVAVEENPYAVEDGMRNQRLNGIGNCTFILSGVDSLDVPGPFDMLVTDPPRTGLTDKAVEKILALAPERVAYISCNPATLSRDLKKLSAAYVVESVRMVDFFPQTYHMESLTLLGRKRA